MITGPVAGKRLPLCPHRIFRPAISTTLCLAMVVTGIVRFDDLHPGGGASDVIVSVLVLVALAWVPIHLFGTTYSVSPTHLIQHRLFRRDRAIEWRALTHVGTQRNTKLRSDFLVLRTAASRFAWLVELNGYQNVTDVITLLGDEVRRRPDLPGGIETVTALDPSFAGEKTYA